MTRVAVCSRTNVVKIHPMPDVALVSISTPREDYEKVVVLDGWHDSIALEFHDTIEPGKDFFGRRMVLFDNVRAEKLYNFLEKNQKRDIIVHCNAGISRSMAVGRFMHDYYGHTLDLTDAGVQTTDYSNIIVYNLLRRLKMGYKE